MPCPNFNCLVATSQLPALQARLYIHRNAFTPAMQQERGREPGTLEERQLLRCHPCACDLVGDFTRCPQCLGSRGPQKRPGNGCGCTPIPKPFLLSHRKNGAHRPGSLFEVQDLGAVRTNCLTAFCTRSSILARQVLRTFWARRRVKRQSFVFTFAAQSRNRPKPSNRTTRERRLHRSNQPIPSF
jgi:hypothetical protein